MDHQEKIANNLPDLKESGGQDGADRITGSVKCERCGKTKGAKPSSMTGWIFQSGTCHCTDTSELSKGAFEAGSDAERVLPDEAQLERLALPTNFSDIKLIGRGGMSDVYKAFDKERNTDVAVKVLKEELLQEEGSLERFKREVNACMRLKHENIVSVFGSGMTKNGRPFMVMEYLQGQTLDNILHQNVFIGWQTALNIFAKVSAALGYAHKRGVIHRDIKPNNIIISESDAGQLTVKLIDFGIAKVRDIKDRETYLLTNTDDAYGSPLYMSPEQGMGERLDARSDIYSLGCVMYEALTGSSPFFDENPIRTVFRHVNEQPEPFSKHKRQLEINSDIEKIVFKCLEKNPANRYKDGGQLRADLELVERGEPVKIQSHASEPDCISNQIINPLWVAISIAVDSALITFTTSSLFQIFSPGGYLNLLSSMLDHNLLVDTEKMNKMLTGTNFLAYSIILLLYFSLFQLSKLRATPGQLLCKLKIADKFGARPSALHVFARNVLWPLIPAHIVIGIFQFLQRISIGDQSIKQAAKRSFYDPWFDEVTATKLVKSNTSRGSAIAPIIAIIATNVLSLWTFLSIPSENNVFPILLMKSSENGYQNEWMIGRFSPFAVSKRTLPSTDPNIVSHQEIQLHKFNPFSYREPRFFVTQYVDGREKVNYRQTEVIRDKKHNLITLETVAEGKTFGKVTLTLHKDGEQITSADMDVQDPLGQNYKVTEYESAKLPKLAFEGSPAVLSWATKDGKNIQPEIEVPYANNIEAASNFVEFSSTSTLKKVSPFTDLKYDEYGSSGLFKVDDAIYLEEPPYLYSKGPTWTVATKSNHHYRLSFDLDAKHHRLKVSVNNVEKVFTKEEGAHKELDFTSNGAVTDIKFDDLDQNAPYTVIIRQLKLNDIDETKNVTSH